MKFETSRSRAAVAALALTACTGSIGVDEASPDGHGNAGHGGGQSVAGAGGRTQGGGGATSAAPVEAAPAHVRRLSATELRNSAGDVLLGGKRPVATFSDETLPHAFSNLSDALSVPVEFASELQSFAEQTAAAATAPANLATILPCASKATDAASATSCVGQLLDGVGLRLYRRPLSADDRASLTTVYAEARAAGADFPQAAATVIEAMLQSPGFLFRTELGVGGARVTDTIVSLNSYEMASALSYAIWGSAPDAALLEAAANGRLGTPAEIEAQAKRLAADPKATAVLEDFLLQWTELDEVPKASKPVKEFTSSLATAMLDEAKAYVGNVVAGEATLERLLTSRATVTNRELGALYGVPTAGLGAALQPAQMDGSKRAGLFGLAGFMTVHTKGEFTPIYPGKFVRTRLLCQELGVAPPNIPPPAPPSPTVSTRERYADHASNAGCAACHKLMDPIGFGFERFDAIGRYRMTEDGGFALTGSGSLVGSDTDGPFTGPVELASKLAGSTVARSCMAAQLLEWAVGRAVASPESRTPADEPTIAALGKQATAGLADARAMLVAVTATDAFRFRDVSGLPAGGKQQ